MNFKYKPGFKSKNYYKHSVLYIMLTMLTLFGFAQAPANDDCSGAVSLPVNADFLCAQTVNGTTVNATQSTETAPTCGATGVNDDVWYSFVATNTSHRITLSNVTGAVTDMAMSIYSGTCGSLTHIQCSDPNTMNVTGLTPGNTYYIRVWTWSPTAGNTASFTICVGTPPPPPANDNCSGAISLPVNADFLCAQTVNGSTTSATQSTETAPTCGATGVNDDVWYSFVATNTSHRITLSNVTGAVTDMAMSIYSGTCGSLTHIQCSDPNTMNVTGLTPGNTYYIRVWTWTPTVGSDANFTICVGTPPAPPANDNCSGAIPVPVNPDFLCAQTVNGSTTSATQSTETAPTCGATGVNDDVWFSFVATNSSHRITLSNITGAVTDMAMSVYSGSCGSLTHIQCSDPNTMNVTGLTPGNTYYIRVWTWTSTVGSDANFTICIGTPPAPPAFDDPCAAVTLNVSTTCNYQTFSTSGATNSTGFPAPGCANYQGGDVWFQVTVPAGGAIIIDTDDGTITDAGMAIYSGDCNTMTLIECDDDDSPNGAMPMITRTGLTPGSTIFIRFWEYGGDADGTFGICVTTPPPPPVNDDPCAAITLTPSATCSYQTYTTAAATTSNGFPAPGCASFNGKDVWFQVTVPAGGAITVDTDDMGITDGGMAIYSGDCNTMTLIECNDDDSPNGLMPMITASGLTPGSTVYIRFWEYGGNAEGTFGICVTIPPPPPANDNCATAISLPVNPDMLCAQTMDGTTQSAGASTGVPATSCNDAGTNDDVWYSFTATSTVQSVSLSNLGGTSTGMAIALYSGTCGSLNYLQCVNGGAPLVAGDLVVGQTYYVRVYTTASSGNSYATFTICVGTPPPPPANDNPCNAITLTVNENGACNFQEFTNESATASSGVPAPGCANYQGGDVWFKIVVPCTGNVTVDANTGVITDAGMAFYSGTCGNLTLLDCDDDGSQNGAMPKITLTNLTVGDTIWVRFWEYGNDNQGTFSLCASTTQPPIVLPALPASPTCDIAQPMCTSTTPYTIPNVSGQTPTSAPGGGIYGCLSLIPNPTYYVLNIQNSGSIELTISQVSNSGQGVDVDFVVWGPFTNASAACTQLSDGNIVDCSYSADAIEQIDIPNAIAGEVYILLVTNWGNQAGMITYQQTGGTGSSSCCPTSATNSTPVVCAGTGLTTNLTSTAVPNATYIWRGPNCYTSNEQNPTNAPVPSAPGQYVYSVTAYTATGQVCGDTTIVTVVARPTLAADTAFKICAGSTANLTTIYNTTGLTNTWTLGGQPVANPAAVNASGIYRLIASNATGCTDTAYVNLTVDTIRAEVAVSQIICTRTGRVTVSPTSGIAPYEYSISTNPGVFQSSNEFVAPEGTHSIIIRDSLGCTATVQATVTIIPEITVNAGADVSIVAGESTQLLASTSATPSSITWSPATGLNSTGILNPIATPPTTTTYTISITNSQGCVAEDDIIVTVIPYCVRVKNAFTPNGDGINDTWQVYGSFDCLRNVTINVFNRYGSLVYRDVKYANNWDGTYKGKPVPDGTYYAVVDFTFITGKKVSVKTDLTILR